MEFDGFDFFDEADLVNRLTVGAANPDYSRHPRRLDFTGEPLA